MKERGRRKDIEALKALVQRLCKFPGHERNKTGEDRSQSINGDHTNGYENGHTNGHSNGITNGAYSTSLKQIESVLLRFTSHILAHPKVLQAPAHIRCQLHYELETCILSHIAHEEDNARFAIQRRQQQHNFAPSSGSTLIPFLSPRTDYYTWVCTISANNIHCPFTFLFFSILAAPKPGEPFFQGVRQHWISSSLCHHLSNICRQYNDHGSVARDVAEGNLNSLNWPEFHRADLSSENGNGDGKNEQEMKKDLFSVAEYERECLDHAMEKLEMEIVGMEEMGGEGGGLGKMDALRAFVDTVDLYGQLYVARDMTPRVK